MTAGSHWPWRVVETELGPHVERVHVLLASGEPHRAQPLARQVKRWVHRAGRSLAERVRGMLGWHAFAQEMAVRYAQLSHSLDNPRLSQQSRHAIGAALAAAKTALETPPTLPGFQQAHAQLEQATTLALQAVSAMVVQEVDAAMRAAAAETSLEEIEAAMSRLTPDEAMVGQQRQLLGILELWDSGLFWRIQRHSPGNAGVSPA